MNNVNNVLFLYICKEIIIILKNYYKKDILRYFILFILRMIALQLHQDIFNEICLFIEMKIIITENK